METDGESTAVATTTVAKDDSSGNIATAAAAALAAAAVKAKVCDWLFSLLTSFSHGIHGKSLW